jgi:hypothetical protein
VKVLTMVREIPASEAVCSVNFGHSSHPTFILRVVHKFGVNK